MKLKYIYPTKKDFKPQNTGTSSIDTSAYNFLNENVTKGNENDTRKIVGYVVNRNNNKTKD